MKPLLCILCHRYQAHAYKGAGFLFCRRCGDMIPLEDPGAEKEEGKE